MEPWQREIEELHDFFAVWFGGDCSSDDGAFRRLEGVLATGFTMVTPDGATVSRSVLLDRLRQAHGARRKLAIRIVEPELLLRRGTLTVARYEEWQEDGDVETARVSTVVFRDAPAAPNGLTWITVHETWKPDV